MGFLTSVLKAAGGAAFALGGVYLAGKSLLQAASSLNDRVQVLLMQHVVVEEELVRAFEGLPAKTAAATLQLLPVIREHLLEQTDLNSLVRDIKRLSAAAAAEARARPPAASTAASTPTGNGSGDSATAEVSALWEEVKLRSFTRVVAAVYLSVCVTGIVRVLLTLSSRLSTTARAAATAHAPDAAAGGAGAGAGAGADGAAYLSPAAACAFDPDSFADQCAARQRECLQCLLLTLLQPAEEGGLHALLAHVRAAVDSAMAGLPVTAPPQAGSGTGSGSGNEGGGGGGPTLIGAAVLTASIARIRAQMEGVPSSSSSCAADLGGVYAPFNPLRILLAHREAGGSSSEGAASGPAPAAAADAGAGAAAAAATPQVPWTASLLLRMCLDVCCSPAFQAAMRQGCEAAFAEATSLAIGGVWGTAAEAAAAAAPASVPLGTAALGIRTVADLALRSAPAVSASVGEGREGAGDSPPPFAVTAALTSRQLQDLCYAVMWHAKLS